MFLNLFGLCNPICFCAINSLHILYGPIVYIGRTTRILPYDLTKCTFFWYYIYTRSVYIYNFICDCILFLLGQAPHALVSTRSVSERLHLILDHTHDTMIGYSYMPHVQGPHCVILRIQRHTSI